MLLRRSEILQLMSTHTKYQVHPSIINTSKPKKIFRPQNLGIKSLTHAGINQAVEPQLVVFFFIFKKCENVLIF